MATIGIDASRANALERSGAEWYAYHLIEALKRLDPPDLEFILYSRGRLRDGLEQLPSGWTSRVLRWEPLPLWTRARLSWELVRHPVDLLFTPTHNLPLVRPRHLVATLHDVGFERHPELYSRSELNYHRPMARRAVRQADRVVTVSEFSRREILEVYRADPARVVVTPNAIDHQAYHAEIPESRQRRTLEKYGLTRPYFLVVGRIEAKKNVANILHAFSIYRSRRSATVPVRLVLVGKPGVGFERITGELAARQLAAHVVMPGYLPEDDLPSLLAGAVALVFPSRYEGFGIPILQSQAVGTPVITANRAAMPEVAGAGALLVDPDDPVAIADAMLRVTGDLALRDSLRSAGFGNVKRYTWEHTARDILRLCMGVLRLNSSG